MTEEKIIGGDPYRPRAEWEKKPTVVVSAEVRADDSPTEFYVPKGPTIIGHDAGLVGSRPKAHWQREALVTHPGDEPEPDPPSPPVAPAVALPADPPTPAVAAERRWKGGAQ